jgi:predicted transposase/invertase (TIGR01784 family)
LATFARANLLCFPLIRAGTQLAPRAAVPYPLLDPKIDVVFKALLQDMPDALADMIECVVDLPGPIASLTVLNHEPPIAHVDDKQVALDILVEVTGFGRINVEMQRAPRAYNAARFLFYWAREYARSLKRGAAYTELTPMISILWLDHTMDPSGPFHSVYRVREDHTHRVYCPHLEIHTLELPKWRKLREIPRTKPFQRLDLWSCIFAEPAVARAISGTGDTLMERIMVKLNAISQDENVPKDPERDELFHRVMVKLNAISQDENLRILAENRERDELFNEWATRTQVREATEAGKREGLEAGKREGLEAGKREGLEAGKREGLEAGKRDVVLRLLHQRFGTVSEEPLQRIASASAEELDHMIACVLTATSIYDVVTASG